MEQIKQFWPEANLSTTQLIMAQKQNESTPLQEVVAMKHDAGKLDWSMLPIDALEEIMKVLEAGKHKYSAWNWSLGEGFKYTRVFNALLRHLFAWMRGEDKDPETGLSHIAHAGCNILFLMHFIIHKDRYTNNDDRPSNV